MNLKEARILAKHLKTSKGRTCQVIHCFASSVACGFRNETPFAACREHITNFLPNPSLRVYVGDVAV